MLIWSPVTINGMGLGVSIVIWTISDLTTKTTIFDDFTMAGENENGQPILFRSGGLAVVLREEGCPYAGDTIILQDFRAVSKLEQR